MISTRRIHHLGPYLLAFILLLAQASAFAHAQSHHDTELGETATCAVCSIAQDLQQGISEAPCIENTLQGIGHLGFQPAANPESSQHSHYSSRAPPSL